MDIRTKLVFALVAASLGSMAALGAVMFQTARNAMAEGTLEHLDALAESRKLDLETILDGWKDRVRLVASRTQLRESVARYNAAHAEEERARIQRILDDAVASAETVLELTVYDGHFHPLASTGTTRPDTLPPQDPARAIAAGDEATYLGVSEAASGDLLLAFAAPLGFGSERVGSLEALLSTRDLIALTRNVRGLGDTGETIVVMRGSGTQPRILHPVRHGSDPTEVEPLVANGGDPTRQVLAGVDSTFVGVRDYRDELVWAATRYLEELDWGVIVKADVSELEAPILAVRTRGIRLALSLSAFAVLFGVLLGLRLTKPIHDLAEVASRISRGDRDARAEVQSEDEVGLLAVTFNRMADALVGENRELQTKLANTDPGLRVVRAAAAGGREAPQGGPASEASDPSLGDAPGAPEAGSPPA